MSGGPWTSVRVAHSGYTAAMLADYIDTMLAPTASEADYILLNIGINDVRYGVLPAELDWKADVSYVLAALNTKWPSATVYVAKPWGSWAGIGGTANDADLDTMAGWIDDLVAGCAYCAAGIDERDAGGIQSVDNGATYTYDGIHYSVAGEALIVTLWRAVLGF